MSGANPFHGLPDVVVVTGAGRGIGRVTAGLLAEAGSTVIAVDLLPGVLDAPTAESSPRWNGLVADITEDAFPGAVIALLTEAMASAGSAAGGTGARGTGSGVTATAPASLGLVNCAFAEQRAAIADGSKAGWQRTMDVNFHAAVDLSRAVANLAITAGHPASLVNVTSVHANLAHAGFGAYSASKAALTAFTRTASEEWGPHNIRVNAVAPGFVAVERNEALWSDPGLVASLKACNNLDRLAGPAEIAAGIMFLLSPAASFITGAVLPIDGGQTSRLLEVPRS